MREGLLEEGHRLDVKRELPRNADLAIDIACLALDGGMIVVGVDEGPPMALNPIALAGLPERIDQVALSRLEPPLRVRVATIADASHDTGYVLIMVPASPEAPHMVDGRYRGRGDTTNRTLSDAEVRRLHADREAEYSDLDTLVQQLIGRHAGGAEPHLLVVAHPMHLSNQALLEAIGAEQPSEWLTRRLLVPVLTRQLTPDISPRFHGGPVRRARGWVFGDGDLVLEIAEGGTLGLAVAGLEGPEAGLVNDVAFLGLVKRVVLAAGAVSEAVGYVGPWWLCVVATGLMGRRSWFMVWGRAIGVVPYDENEYVESATVLSDDLVADRDAAVRRLLGPLMRSLNGDSAPIPN